MKYYSIIPVCICFSLLLAFHKNSGMTLVVWTVFMSFIYELNFQSLEYFMRSYMDAQILIVFSKQVFFITIYICSMIFLFVPYSAEYKGVIVGDILLAVYLISAHIVMQLKIQNTLKIEGGPTMR